LVRARVVHGIDGRVGAELLGTGVCGAAAVGCETGTCGFVRVGGGYDAHVWVRKQARQHLGGRPSETDDAEA